MLLATEAGAFFPGTQITFDDVMAPCDFVLTTPLRDEYSSMGVTFSGDSANDGGAILGSCSNFHVTGFSSPNFLAFNSPGTMSNGGHPIFPEILDFLPPVSYVDFDIASSHDIAAAQPLAADQVTVEAFDHDGNLLTESTHVIGSAMTQVGVEHPGIFRVTILVNTAAVVVDDLRFIPDTTLINFEDLDPAPDLFKDTTALRDRYKALGIEFRGSGNDGGAILSDLTYFGVTGYSAPNFLAFVPDATLSDGAAPVMPETLLFDPPIKFLQYNVASSPGYEGNVHMEAENTLGDPVDLNDITTQSAMQSFSVVGRGITNVYLSTDSGDTVIDDLQFTQEEPCAHDPCYAGAALDRYCAICTENVCSSHPECCDSGWSSLCALSTKDLCEITCLPLCGDANDDRKVTATDALLTLKTAVGAGTCIPARCDFNGDGLVKAVDALLVLKFSVGNMVTPDCPPVV